MLIKHLYECDELTAIDNTTLREVLHEKNDNVKLNCSIAYAILDHGKKSLPHRLTTNMIYFIVKGEGLLFLGEHKSHKIAVGDALFIPPKVVRSMRNTGDTALEYLCISDPAWHPNNEEIIVDV